MAFALRLLLAMAAFALVGFACTDDESSAIPTADQTPTSDEAPTSSTTVITDEASLITSNTTIELDGCQDLTVDKALVGRFDPDRGINQIVVGRGDDGQYMLALCQGDPSTVALGANKPPQAFVADIEGDGTDEVFVGAATGASPFIGTTVAVIEGRLVDSQVRLEVTLAGSGRDGSSFGCVDTDSDGRRELVSLRYRFSADGLDDSEQVTWWRWPAGASPDTGSETGTYDPTADRRSIETLIDGTCGDLVLVDVAS
ncbi:MAG: hypothetical protein OEV40_18565 [Acidimicrobiia bacterium]|nr:hypothetical protein [Acidimicrobiia bacterium]